mgnify:CR=1 FL=1|eukprot:scaffold120924_cov39-Tisochrysis_lutea.AAC.3
MALLLLALTAGLAPSLRPAAVGGRAAQPLMMPKATPKVRDVEDRGTGELAPTAASPDSLASP